MRVVSENSEHDIQRERARQDIVWPLKELAANVIRVVRGAGKPHEIASQAGRVVLAFEAYHDVVGHYPPGHEIQDAINIRYHSEQWETDDVDWAVDQIIQGSLQVAASRVLAQNTQEAAGERELKDGVRSMEKAQEAIRARQTRNR